MSAQNRFFLIATGAAFALGCVQQLPAPQAPDRAISAELEAQVREPASPGQGRLAIVVDDGPARVEDLGTEADGAGANEICASTPCVADLSLGEHTLFLHHGGRDDRVNVRVTEAPRAHRRVMSFDSGTHAEYLALAIGGFTLALAMAPVIEPLSAIDGNLGGPEAGLITAAVVGGVGLVTALVAVVMTIADPQQTREGASSEWELSLATD